MPDFARLETHDGLQVLCMIDPRETDAGEYGPCVVTRCHPSFVVSMTKGPFPDTEEGWAAAEKILAEKDLAAFAVEARAMAENGPLGA